MDNNFTNINETNIFIIILIVEYIAWSDSRDFISMMIGIVDIEYSRFHPHATYRKDVLVG
jgi:hypothetical protein